MRSENISKRVVRSTFRSQKTVLGSHLDLEDLNTQTKANPSSSRIRSDSDILYHSVSSATASQSHTARHLNLRCLCTYRQSHSITEPQQREAEAEEVVVVAEEAIVVVAEAAQTRTTATTIRSSPTKSWVLSHLSFAHPTNNTTQTQHEILIVRGGPEQHQHRQPFGLLRQRVLLHTL